ncbi:hypothetical protein ABFS83_01G039000 [Erythranthe nasuta]
MGCEEIETGEESEEMDDVILSSMWPEDINEAGRQFNIERPGLSDLDMLEEVTIIKEPNIVDFKRLMELTNYSDKGNWQLANLVKNWEYKQENAVRLLQEELVNLSKQQKAVELKKLKILEEHRFEKDEYGGDKRPVSILDESLRYLYQDQDQDSPVRKRDVVCGGGDREVEVADEENDGGMFWKKRALSLEKLLEASLRREKILLVKLEESIENLERQSSPVEELSQVLKRADNFLHFVLQNAPVVIGHQDKELRYRFIFNHFPSLREEDIIGKTDVEIFKGAGVKESQDFKKEVMERGIPAKREITFETELFGSKTFLIYAEPVFSKAGETIGVNYMGMEVTDQVRKREKMAKLREEMAVQKAKETELNKTIHITEESMRAKQMLATMSHEIRSPLSGVVSMAEILSTTKLDKEQRKLLSVMLSSGDLVLQLINDILDLSKVESGVMKLEATKFRPREVVNHVLQTSAASLQKLLTLEGNVSVDVPVEVVGDVLRIRQILTNLISNAIKFTHEGKVGIRLYVVPEPRNGIIKDSETDSSNQSADDSSNTSNLNDENAPENVRNCVPMEEDNVSDSNTDKEQVVWIRCDVYDTGIGIPEHAIPTLFKKYMQAGADTARKYGGTGLGLAICKQLVELMGGHLTVSSVEHSGSIFTFVLPYRVSSTSENPDDSDEIYSDMENDQDNVRDDDLNSGVFVFPPRTLGSLFSSQSSGRIQKLSPQNNAQETIASPSSSSHIITCEDIGSGNDECSTSDNLNLGRRDEKYDKVETDASIECLEIPKTEEENKPRILLVEDNKINVMVTKSMMKQLGHCIDVVSNGAEAVRSVQCKCYDLVLMDVCMPVMDGLEATRLIRSFEETGNWDNAVKAGVELQLPSSNSRREKSRNRIPIIAMTANALSESGDDCFANGMDSFVSKPITFQNLKQCLQKYLP